jgi:6-phosphogluconolactonase/glucosamine-6-phosphate isomerase/deaminase
MLSKMDNLEAEASPMGEFHFEPSKHVPFRDSKAIARCRAITREHIDKHPNPKLKIRVVKDGDIPYIVLAEMVGRIHRAAEAGKPLVLILPNPVPLYRQVARVLNAIHQRCDHLHLFAMDEYANEKGQIAPDTWEFGFGYAMKKNFIASLDPELRPPEKQVHVFTDANLKDYGKMITDLGGADWCYSGPGWTGHLAFVEPDAPEFDAPLEEWEKMGPRICTLSPFTLAQNSLHGSFGMSGDLSAVPPKAATIGPAQVIEAKNRIDIHALGVHGTSTSWQRLVTRLCLHGPVTPRIPGSIHQMLKTDVYVSETAAMNIEPNWDKGY